jgi:hypothetical protein
MASTQTASRRRDTVRSICDGWVLAREQELEPNTVYNCRWLLGLIYPHVGGVRASRLSSRMIQRGYHDLEAAGYSRTTLRRLNLVLVKAFDEQAGRSLGQHRMPRRSAPGVPGGPGQ